MFRGATVSVAIVLLGAAAGYFAGRETPPPTDAKAPDSSPPRGGRKDAGPALPAWPFFDAAKPDNFYNVLAAHPDLIFRHSIADFSAEVRRDLRLYGIIGAWLARDTEKAAAWVARQPVEWVSVFLEDFGDAVGSHSPEAAIVLLQRLGEPGKFPVLEETLVAALPLALDRLKAVLTSPSPLLQSSRMEQLWYGWARREPAEALAAAKTAGWSGKNYGNLLLACSHAAPDAALTETSVLSSSERAMTVSDILRRLAEDDPAKTLQYLVNNPDSPGLEARAIEAWQTMLDSGNPLPANISEMLPEKLRSYAGIMAARAERDPAAAAEKLSAAWVPDAPETFVTSGSYTAGRLAKNLAMADPVKALAWAATLPGTWRAGAYEGAAEIAAYSDPVELSEWLNTAPASPDLDRVISRLVTQVPDDPAAAYSWAGRISSPLLKNEALEFIAKSWPAFVPPAAEPPPPNK